MKFLIVGVGNIGFRHLQGLTNLPYNQIEFYLLDKDYSYKKRFKKEIKEINQNYSLKENININELIKIKFELVIISTTASDRSKILFEILNKINTKYILIEKPICQSLKELEELRKITKKNIFVNFPRRYCDWHKNIKNKIALKKFKEIKKIEITGGYIGLACNACHFVDLINFWFGKNPLRVDTSKLGNWYSSKRAGFFEVEGNMKIFFSNNLLLEINSYMQKKNTELNIYDNKGELFLNLNFAKGYAKFSDGEVIKGRLKFQSESTHELLKFIQNGNKEICSLQNAVSSYSILLRELIKSWNTKFKKNEKKIMIT